MSTQKKEEVGGQELEQRVLYAMLIAVARLGRVFGVPLKDLRGLLDTAYFQELRARGLTQREVAEALGVSERTAVKLSRQAREQFLGPAVVHNLPRRIEFMLGAEAMGLGRIAQLLPDADADLVRAAVEELMSQGRVREVQGRTLKYEPAAPARRLPRDSWMQRVGGLNSFVENLTNAVYGRFFKQEPRAFARTLTFRGGPDAFEKLSGFYEASILPGLRSMHLDEPQSDTEAAQVSLCWAPYEYMNTKEDTEES